MTSTRDDLAELSRFAWSRLDERLGGLTDAEYLWEPVPGCLTVRPVGDGRYRSDGPAPRAGGQPFTTLAWRLSHLADLLDAQRNGPWLGVPATESPRDGDPGTAADALAVLRGAYDVWRRVLDSTTDDGLAEPIGEIGGPFADSTRRAFALHILDELIHHGAEVALLRDLYRARPG
jgi:hypothetical protein